MALDTKKYWEKKTLKVENSNFLLTKNETHESLKSKDFKKHKWWKGPLGLT